MYERLIKQTGGRGSAAEVWIDYGKRLIKKIYKVDGIGHRGNTIHENSHHTLEQLWHNEIKYSKEFNDIAVPIVDYGQTNKNFWLIQDYYGPDLLDFHIDGTLHTRFPNITAEIIEVFELFQSKKLYKQNHALSNITGHNGSIKIFDFKYVTERNEDTKFIERLCIHKWISKIDKNLIPVLEATV